jgi:hypothetical protein
MKYAMQLMAFSPQKGHFEYLYYRRDDRYTTKLSQATTWNDVIEIEKLILKKDFTDCRICHVTDKELFEARLKG